MEQKINTSADLVFVTLDEESRTKYVLVYARTWEGRMWKEDHLHNHAWYVSSICDGKDFIIKGDEIALELYEKLCRDTNLTVAWLG